MYLSDTESNCIENRRETDGYSFILASLIFATCRYVIFDMSNQKRHYNVIKE